MTKSPRVSVVLPVYNSARFLRAAVQSILDQSFRDFELLAVDDGSTDESLAILKAIASEDARVFVHAESHRGLVGALNHGIALARGTYIARMDADDIALPQRFERQVLYLDRNPGCVVLGTAMQKIDASNKPGRVKNRRVALFDLMAFPPSCPKVAHPTAMIRADALRRIGGYREAFQGAEDRDLWTRIGTLGSIENLPEVLLRYRVHSSSVTQSHGPTRYYLTQIVIDLAAVARTLGLDDEPILQEMQASGDKQAAILSLVGLIGDRWPAKTYWLYFLINHRSWRLLGFTSRLEMLRGVVAHARRASSPASAWRLIAAALRHSFSAHTPIHTGKL